VKENRATNVEELDKRINDEKGKITEQVEKIGSDTLMTSVTPFKEALDELNRIKKRTDES
jgi:hypothetical protein